MYWYMFDSTINDVFCVTWAQVWGWPLPQCLGPGPQPSNTRKDLGFCILVKSLQYKGEVKNSKLEKLIELYRVNVKGVYA